MCLLEPSFSVSSCDLQLIAVLEALKVLLYIDRYIDRYVSYVCLFDFVVWFTGLMYLELGRFFFP